MKKTLILLSLAFMGTLGIMAAPSCKKAPCKKQACDSAAVARVYQGPGPVMAASALPSQLPQKAKDFLAEYFPGYKIEDVENDFADQKYEVDLADGVDVEFDYQGNWVKIDAPDGAMLPSSTLAALVPESVVTQTLQGDAILPGGVTEYVETISSFPEYYVVKVNAPSGKSRAAISKSDGSLKRSAKQARMAKKSHKDKKREGKAIPASWRR